MHLFDLHSIPTAQDHIEPELVEDRHGGQLRAWKSAQWMKRRNVVQCTQEPIGKPKPDQTTKIWQSQDSGPEIHPS